MLRIRRRFAMVISGGCLLVFLSLYFLLNYAAPAANSRKPNLGAIESKLQMLENGLQEHGWEMEKLRARLVKTPPRNVAKPLQSQAQQFHAGAMTGQCTDVVQKVPEVDVQMLDLYDRMSFEDTNGGVWKQGWNIKYDPLKYNSHHRLKVFVVPHSHNDPGWKQTFEDYFQQETKNILSNALRHLQENPNMKFIWAEISYFARFYEDLGENKKLQMKSIIKSGQLEFVTGGWVMPDEANSHWRNVLLQLTEGQTWLKQTFNITPTSSWAIDPFGHSPTLPYILQKSGFDNLLIQRTHYSVKKELALHQLLEFHWRQLWDTTGSTSLFTHMMPFYSYDIPHTCGPDPKICCQFDFKRMGAFGINCPWHVPPQPIDDNNVAARSELLVDQWKKKAELYRTKALLIPLGDDFRYKQNTEWDVQRVNYEKLFEHINSQSHFNVEAQFGTLQEYFDAVHKDGNHQFPTLSGDFFTYADRTDNYWSGYFTSRPYHKRMDRVLMHYVRAAEMLHAWDQWDESTGFTKKLQLARRELSLFQHHDGITGTAKTHVMLDYEKRMQDALRACSFVMQQAIYRLLTASEIYSPDYFFHYFTLDDSRWPGSGVNDTRTTIILGEELPTKHIVVHNTQPRWREQLVDFYVSSPFIAVSDLSDKTVEAQISPVWSWHHDTLTNTIHPQGSTTKYRLIFKARVPPMGLATYLLTLTSSKPPQTSFASNLMLTTNPMSMPLGEYPLGVKFGEHRALSLRVGDGPTLAFSEHGLLKSIQLTPDKPHVPVHLKFLRYGTRVHGDRSGAYLFLPNGPATPFVDMQPPVVLVTEGKLESSVSVGLPFVVHQTILRGDAPEIRNLVDIGRMDNTEIVMRLQTQIDNGDIFYTDLNGLQHIKRRRLEKLPLQANYYPVPAAMFIEDVNMRLTLLTAQPLGGSSLATGDMEIMQDRRLAADDERGLGQGVLDNKPVMHIFRLVLEEINGCVQPSEQHPAGYLTRAAHIASQSLLDPMDKFIYTENTWTGAQESFGSSHSAADEDLDVVVMRRLSERKAKTQRIGFVLHRTQLLQCRNSPPPVASTDKFDACNLLQRDESPAFSCHRTTLTFLKQLELFENKRAPPICPMETTAYTVTYSSNSS